MKTFKKILLISLCSISSLLGFLIVLFIRLFWGQNLYWNNGLWCELREDSWFYNKFYKGWGGTTLGYCGFYAPGQEKYCNLHEHFHVRQFSSFILGLLIATIPLLILSWKLFLVVLLLGYPIWIGSIYLETWLLGKKDLYRDNTIEIAAYAIDELNKK